MNFLTKTYPQEEKIEVETDKTLLDDLEPDEDFLEVPVESQERLEEESPFVAVDFSKIRASKTISKSVRGTRSNAAVTIVNTTKNGKRVTLSKEVVEKLDRPESLQVGFGDGQLILGNNILPNDSPNYKVSYTEKSGANIYAGGLVGEITEEFDLDFNGITSISFSKVSYTKAANCTIAVVEMV